MSGKRFEGMLFCSDLDGTLFCDDKSVSRENLDAIEYFKSEGGLFTFITGRVPATTRTIYDTIHPNAPYGCINGAAIYDEQKGEYLYKVCLDEAVKELASCVDKNLPDIGIQFSTEKAVYFNKDNEAMQIFRRLTGLPYVTCPYEEIKESSLKLIFGHTDERQIEKLEELLLSHPMAERFEFIRSEKMIYEVLPKGATKGKALRMLAKLLGIEARNTVAVGDYNNDVSMLEAAGISFAVANAIPEVKAVADHVTVSNNENAIAAIVYGLDKGTYRLSRFF